MSPQKQRIYKIRKKENDTILDLSLKYKHINPLILLINTWKNLSDNDKKKYEIYSDDLTIFKNKIRDIYDGINGVNPKTPAGALRIFLQFKAKKHEINSISEGIEKWKQLSNDKKDHYLKISHKFYLAYKYKQLLFNKKINRIYPKKPTGSFQFYLIDKKGIKVPKGINTIKYWRNKFDSLDKKEIEKYNTKYLLALEDYNKKAEYFKDKIFDFPIKPKSPFTYYVNFKFDELSKDNNNIILKDYFEIISKEWSKGNIDKKQFQLMSDNDKKRYKKQVIQFEKFGFYYKEFDYEYINNKSDELKENNLLESKNNNIKKKKRSNNLDKCYGKKKKPPFSF